MALSSPAASCPAPRRCWRAARWCSLPRSRVVSDCLSYRRRKSLGGLAYLIVLGSIIAYTAYQFLLRTVRPTLASYSYLNPVVALVLGEAIPRRAIFTLGMILG